MFRLLLICGGISDERDISLNTTRSLYDNLGKNSNIDVKIMFVDLMKNMYLVEDTFLYSNTTSDFDFKLSKEAKMLSESEIDALLLSTDMAFPVMHGTFGEDGEIQRFLTLKRVPFVASPASACEKMYNKGKADELILKAKNLYRVNKIFFHKTDDRFEIRTKLCEFMRENNEVVIKPTEGGSSFGVSKADNIKTAYLAIRRLLKRKKSVLVEEKCKGREFTVIIAENHLNEPVAFIPTEIEITSKENEIFDTRRKYLATTETHYHNPPRFSDEIISEIRKTAEDLFTFIGARDILRIDGWLMDCGELYFSDFNPISGMEQNSFIFQQGSRIGMTHEALLYYILKHAAKRQGLVFPEKLQNDTIKKPVNVIFGGISSEKQVSLMSGTNIWLKLIHSDKYIPTPFFLYEKNGEYEIIRIPYYLALNHTVEEIVYQLENITDVTRLTREIREKLGISDDEMCDTIPSKAYSIDEFIKLSKENNAFVFLGLHGGIGENGTLQEKLQKNGVNFNGSGENASSLCMNKALTGKIINDTCDEIVSSSHKFSTTRKKLINLYNDKKLHEFYLMITGTFKSEKFIIKPLDDGCSTGVIIINNYDNFEKLIGFYKDNIFEILAKTFDKQDEPIILSKSLNLLIEEYTETDKIAVINNELIYEKKTGWVELTVGVLEKKGEYHSLSPSISVAKSGVLTLEEKFQGGTGINITPPPEEIISQDFTKLIMEKMELCAMKAGIEGYCRIDIFANIITKKIIVIEINTLPGLSPSTVLFQQAAKENPPLTPIDFIHKLIENKL